MGFAVGSYVLHLYSKRYDVIGTMEIHDGEILISKPSFQKVFLFSEIKNPVVRRRSTFHHSYEKDNKLFYSDNWLEFIHDAEEYKFEFSLESISHDNELIEVVNYLARTRTDFSFFTV